jgi:hypothetical protein
MWFWPEECVLDMIMPLHGSLYAAYLYAKLYEDKHSLTREEQDFALL